MLLSRVVPAIAIVVLIGIIYLPTLSYFFQFDDAIFLRDGNLRAGRLDAFLGPPVPRAAAWVSFAVQIHLLGEEPAGFRLVNVVLHAANSLLVFFLLLLVSRGLEGRRWREGERSLSAVLGAVVFAVHPLAVEPVVHIYQRSTLLAAGFALLATVLWVQGRGDSGRDLGPGRTALVVGAFALALCSKEYVVLLPLILWSYDRLQGKSQHSRASTRRELAWVSLTAIAGALILFSRIENAAGNLWLWPGFSYLATQLWAWWRYLALTLLPIGLNADHQLAPVSGWGDPWWWMALAGLAFLGGVLWRIAGQSPSARFWIVAYVVFLVPTSSFVSSPDFFFEHRVYASLAGYAGLLGLAAAACYRKWRQDPRRRVLAALLAVAVPGVFVLQLIAMRRTQVWAGPDTLWRDAAAKSPDKYRPHFNLGVALMADSPEEASRHLSRAIEIDASQPSAYRSLGQLALNRGELESAERLWRQSLMLEPGHAQTLLALGKLYARERDYQAARDSLEAAAEVSPDDPEVRYQLAVLHLRFGFSQPSIEEAEQGLSNNPAETKLRVVLADAVAAQHNWPRAAELYQQALSQSPEPLVFYRLARVFKAMGDLPRARGAVRRGIETARSDSERSMGKELLALYGE